MAYKDKEKQKEKVREMMRRYREKKKMGITQGITGITEEGITEGITGITREGITRYNAGITEEGITGITQGITQGITEGVTDNFGVTRDYVTNDVTEDVTLNDTLIDTLTPDTEPELDPTVLYLTVLSQRVDALAAEVTELKKVGSAIKIDSLMPILKGMVEEALKEIKGRIVKLEEVVESLENRVSKIEELLQDFQTGVNVGWKGGGHSSRHTSKDNGNGELEFGKSRQAQGKLPKRYIFGRLVE